MNEEFIHFESKVNQILKILEEVDAASKSEAEGGKAEGAKKPIEIDEDNCILTVRDDRTLINRKPDSSEQMDKSEMNKFTFMQQLEEDADERARVRQEREKIAQNFRSLGNAAYRKQQYEKAITMYTKAIEHVKDSPILYNNRALSYIKLKNFNRGIIDCDYILNKLDEKNLRAWLYRAVAFKRSNDEKNFESSIAFAKYHNIKQHEYIDNFIEKMKTEF